MDQCAVDDAFAQDEAQFVRVQQQSGVDLFSDGLIRWQDIFRPLSESGRPASFAGSTPTPSSAPRSCLTPSRANSQRPGIVPADSVPRPRVATFPSPYMFSRAARAGRRDRNELMAQIAQSLLRPAIEAAVAGRRRA